MNLSLVLFFQCAFHLVICQKPITIPPPNSEDLARNRILDRPTDPPDIKSVYVYEDCNHKGDAVAVEMPLNILQDSYGLLVWWNYRQNAKTDYDSPNNGSYAGFSDIKGIFDCTITIKLGPHDNTISYQELIFGYTYWIQYDYTPDIAYYIATEARKLDPDNTLANKGLKELRAACKGTEKINNDLACEDLGCVIINYGNLTKKSCYVNTEQNIGPDGYWFTRDTVTIRVLMIGSMIGKDINGKNVYIRYPPHSIKLRLDFTRLYGGPCHYSNQFFCRTHGVCIKYSLACDPFKMVNCPKYSPSNYDETFSCPSYVNSIPSDTNANSPGAMQSLQIFWALLGILLAFILLLILNYLFWRPGYIIWRCGRIRNWCGFGNICYKFCNKCSKGNCATCCKSSGKFDTNDPVTESWYKYPVGDGFHLRENR